MKLTSGAKTSKSTKSKTETNESAFFFPDELGLEKQTKNKY